MASSTYWYNLYKKKKELVKKYESNIKDLNSILSNLQDNLWDEIRNVNNEIDDLKEDLVKGVRHNSRFTSRANTLGNQKEKAVTADLLLRVSVDEVQTEIHRLTSLKNSAITARDDYYRKYKNAKDQEIKDAFKKITG